MIPFYWRCYRSALGWSELLGGVCGRWSRGRSVLETFQVRWRRRFLFGVVLGKSLGNSFLILFLNILYSLGKHREIFFCIFVGWFLCENWVFIAERSSFIVTSVKIFHQFWAFWFFFTDFGCCWERLIYLRAFFKQIIRRDIIDNLSSFHSTVELNRYYGSWLLTTWRPISRLELLLGWRLIGTTLSKSPVVIWRLILCAKIAKTSSCRCFCCLIRKFLLVFHLRFRRFPDFRMSWASPQHLYSLRIEIN